MLIYWSFCSQGGRYGFVQELPRVEPQLSIQERMNEARVATLAEMLEFDPPAVGVS